MSLRTSVCTLHVVHTSLTLLSPLTKHPPPKINAQTSPSPLETSFSKTLYTHPNFPPPSYYTAHNGPFYNPVAQIFSIIESSLSRDKNLSTRAYSAIRLIWGNGTRARGGGGSSPLGPFRARRGSRARARATPYYYPYIPVPGVAKVPQACMCRGDDQMSNREALVVW